MQSDLWVEVHGRPPCCDSRRLGNREQLAANDLVQLRSLPSRLTQQSVHARQRLDASAKAGGELGGVFGAPQGLMRNRLHHREGVFDAMVELTHQELLCFLVALAFGDIARGAKPLDDLATGA